MEQAGKVVARLLCIALGMSGATQHLAGMRDSEVIAAFNKNGEVPLFRAADYGVVTDPCTAPPELIEKPWVGRMDRVSGVRTAFAAGPSAPTRRDLGR